MSWTTPKNWATNDLVTVADLNVQLSGNLTKMKNPPTALHNVNEAAYSTSSTSYAVCGEQHNVNEVTYQLTWYLKLTDLENVWVIGDAVLGVPGFSTRLGL